MTHGTARKHGNIAVILFGAVAGIVGSQLLPAGTFLRHAVQSIVANRSFAELIVAVAFAFGGAEGALLIRPLVTNSRRNAQSNKGPGA